MNNNLNYQVYSAHDHTYVSQATNLPYHAKSFWDIRNFDFSSLVFPGEILNYTFSDRVVHAVYKFGNDSVAHATVNKKSVNLDMAGRNKKELEDHLRVLKSLIPPAIDAKEGRVKVKFWYMTNSGPSYVQREIAVPSWDQIRSNYACRTSEDLTKLLFDFSPSHGGQLILWQGDPGTGKTYALRSLCEAWKSWCDVEYIVDPDAFFGANPSYLMSLVSAGVDVYDEDNELVEEEPEIKKDWKLFILEDTGELLSVDARERSGQGLARLLNVVDGFIGQGLKVLVLITSNEQLEKLHTAVSRPGRTAAIVEFDYLGHDAAQEWASQRGIKLLEKKSRYSLAELFALEKDFVNKPEDKLTNVFGFRKPGE